MVEWELEVDQFDLNILDFFVLTGLLTKGKKCKLNESSGFHIPK